MVDLAGAKPIAVTPEGGLAEPDTRLHYVSCTPEGLASNLLVQPALNLAGGIPGVKGLNLPPAPVRGSQFLS